jgi:glycosyltransferase involved in cell wall biosynthesis
MPSLYNVSDLVVLPSIYEPFGKVLVEAMACGKPVVATQTSGIPEVVLNNETGILVPPRRPTFLAQAIIKILSDKKTSEKMGLKGRQRAIRLFTWQKVAERVHQAYKEVKLERERDHENT